MNFLRTEDFTKKDVERVFELADSLRKGHRRRLKEGSTLALIFEKPSTRTRVSFEAAMAQLGGSSIYIDSSTSQLSRGELMRDTAKVLSSYVDFIAARLYKHSRIEELGEYSDVPVINALTDLEHPCQALSDLYTIKMRKKKLRGLKIVFIGDIAANTANSLMVAGAMMGARITLVGPKNYAPNKAYVNKARRYSSVEVESNIAKGVKGADIIYTDTFVSMGEEATAESRRKLFKFYQLNDAVLKQAGSRALVMHCLPAHRGEEITSSVIDGRRSIVWEQARNKLLVEKAILLYLSEHS